MNRRNFIKTTTLAATLAGISPSLMANSIRPNGAKKIIFVFRGVGYTDAFNAFKKFNIENNLSFHIQKVSSSNLSFSHMEGMENLISGVKAKKTITQTQLKDRYTIPQVIEDAFLSTDKTTEIIWMHHTEICHSSYKTYNERLEEFFTELSKRYQNEKHKIIVTADIGRNEKNNSCGGRDHSNASSLETFALYIGGSASKLAAKNTISSQKDILLQKF